MTERYHPVYEEQPADGLEVVRRDPDRSLKLHLSQRAQFAMDLTSEQLTSEEEDRIIRKLTADYLHSH